MPRLNRPRLQRLSSTIVVAVLAIVGYAVVASGGEESADPLAVSALIGVPGAGEADAAVESALAGDSPTTPTTADTAPAEIPTTAPIPFPTATPVPPTATPVPPTPAPTPLPTAAERSATIEAVTGDGQSSATAETVEPAIPTATAQPEPTPEATAAPQPTATPEPTLEPTATPEPTPTEAPTVAPVDSGSAEAYVLAQVNTVRAQAGLAPLQLSAEISAISRDWAAQMAAAGGISHRPQAELSAMLPAGWRTWGENVASGPDVQWAQSGLERSPGHYANMVDPAFTHVGIGVVVVNGIAWVVQNFAAY